MHVLYYSPRACSFAVHVVLEEIGAPFQTRRVEIARAQHESTEYTKVNPLQRVPALETPHGVLTEASAILQYLARTHPEVHLLPREPHDPTLARAQEWLGFLASSVHPAFAPIFRPDRFADDDAARETVVAKQRARAHELLVHAARRFGSGPWALGDVFSVVDPYLLVFMLWARRIGLPKEGLEPLTSFAARALARPSVVRAMATEQQASMPG